MSLPGIQGLRIFQTKQFGTKYHDVGNSVISDSNGGFLIIGTTHSDSSDMGYLLKLDYNLNTVWEVEYNIEGGSYKFLDGLRNNQNDFIILSNFINESISTNSLQKWNDEGILMYERIFNENHNFYKLKWLDSQSFVVIGTQHVSNFEGEFDYVKISKFVENTFEETVSQYYSDSNLMTIYSVYFDSEFVYATGHDGQKEGIVKKFNLNLDCLYTIKYEVLFSVIVPVTSSELQVVGPDASYPTILLCYVLSSADLVLCSRNYWSFLTCDTSLRTVIHSTEWISETLILAGGVHSTSNEYPFILEYPSEFVYYGTGGSMDSFNSVSSNTFGNFLSVGQITLTKGIGDTDVGVVLLKKFCNPGEYEDSDACVQCPAGTFNPLNGSTTNVCSVCSSIQIGNQAGQATCLSEESYETARRFYGTNESEEGLAIEAAKNGDLYILGETTSGNPYLWLLRTNYEGLLYFKFVLKSLSIATKPLMILANDTDTPIIILKLFPVSSGVPYMYMYKFSSNGSILWIQDFTSSSSQIYNAQSIKKYGSNLGIILGQGYTSKSYFHMNFDQRTGAVLGKSSGSQIYGYVYTDIIETINGKFLKLVYLPAVETCIYLQSYFFSGKDRELCIAGTKLMRIKNILNGNFVSVGPSINGKTIKYLEFTESLFLINNRTISLNIKCETQDLVFLNNNQIVVFGSTLDKTWVAIGLDQNGLVEWTIQEPGHTFASVAVTNLGNMAVLGTYSGSEAPHGLSEISLIIYKLKCFPGEYHDGYKCSKCAGGKSNTLGGTFNSVACISCQTHYNMEGQIKCGYECVFSHYEIHNTDHGEGQGLSIMSFNNTEYIFLNNDTNDLVQIAVLTRISKDGEILWNISLNSYDSKYDAKNIVISKDSHILLMANLHDPTGANLHITICKIGSLGELVWMNQITSLSTYSGIRIATAGDSSLVICGYQTISAKNSAASVLITDLSGSLQYYSSVGLGNTERFSDVKFLPNSSTLICVGETDGNVLVFQYNLKGTLQKQIVFGGWTGYAARVEVMPTGHIAVYGRNTSVINGTFYMELCPDLVVFFQQTFPLLTQFEPLDFRRRTTDEFIIAGYLIEGPTQIGAVFGMNIFAQKSWYYYYNSSLPRINEVAVDLNGSFAVVGNVGGSSNRVGVFISVFSAEEQTDTSNNECQQCGTHTFSNKDTSLSCTYCESSASSSKCDLCVNQSFQYYSNQPYCLSNVSQNIKNYTIENLVKEEGLSVLPAPNNEFYLMVKLISNGNRIKLYRMTQNGTIIWEQLMGCTVSGTPSNFALIETSSVIFAAHIPEGCISTNTPYLYIIKYNEKGEFLALQKLAENITQINRIVVNSDNFFYLIGADHSASDSYGKVMSFDSTFSKQYETTISINYTVFLDGVFLSGSNMLFVVGYVNSDVHHCQITKIDASGTYNLKEILCDITSSNLCRRILILSNGNMGVLGGIQPTEDTEFLQYFEIDENLVVQNGVTFPTSKWDPCMDFEQYSDSSLLFVGSTKLFTPDYSIGKIIITFSNASLQSMNFSDPQYSLQYQEVALTPSGNAGIIGTNLVSKKATLSLIKTACFPGEEKVSDECSPCFPGSANPNFGQQCSQCATQTYQSDFMQEACLLCPDNTVQPYLGKLYCINKINVEYNRTILEKSSYGAIGLSVLPFENGAFAVLSLISAPKLICRIDVFNESHELFSTEISDPSIHYSPLQLDKVEDNDFILLTNCLISTKHSIILRRYDIWGQLRWEQKIEGLLNPFKLRKGISELFFIVGQLSNTEKKPAILIITNNGTIINSLSLPEEGRFYDVMELSDSTIICVGGIFPVYGGIQFSYFVRFGSDLAILSQLQLSLTQKTEFYSNLVLLSQTQLGIIGNSKRSSAKPNSYYVKSDIEGNILRQTINSISASESSFSIIRSNYGTVMAYSTDYVSSSKGQVMMLDEEGVILHINGTYTGYVEHFFDLNSNSKGDLIIVGSTTEHGKNDAVIYVWSFVCDFGQYYQNKVCLSCPVGTFNSEKNMSASCKKCPVGYYQNLTGKSSCNICPPKFYQPNTGQIQCLLCPANTYTLSFGSTYCQSCPASFDSIEIEEQCKSCPAGYYYSDSACKKCHSNCAICNNSATNCTECAAVDGIYPHFESPFSYSCLCNSSKGYFENEFGECLKCNLLCELCTGSSSENCTSCIEHPLVIKSDKNCECKSGYYYSHNESEICRECDEFCTACELGASQCTKCLSHPGIQFIETSYPYGNCLCIAERYFVNHQYSRKECSQCHPLCLKCSGNTTDECYSCDTSLFAEFESPSTCKCKTKYFYSTKEKTCKKCNPLCSECVGPTSSDCSACAANTAFLLPNQNLCTEDCTTAGSYYNGNGVCVPCNSNCNQCYGPESDNCLSCSNSSYLLYDGHCSKNCPSHYFADSEKNCIKCHDSCGDCFDSTKSGCLNCNSSNLLLFGSLCVENCPSSSYQFNATTCAACVSPCESCTSASICISCAEGYYFVSNKGICVSSTLCPTGTYADTSTSSCKSCHHSCFTCSGPGFSQCLSCLYSTYNQGMCQPIQCSSGEYPLYDNKTSTVECASCPESCSECSSETNCTACKETYHLFASTCLTCKEYHRGLTEGENGLCKEICGDGINLGECQCDDGNTLDGDGCSSECQIEYGFDCLSNSNNPDICIDISPPTAFLTVLTSNQLKIVFSKPVVLLFNASYFTSSLSLILTNSKCDLGWKITQNIGSGSIVKTIHIQTNVECSLTGKREVFKLYFNHPEAIQDLKGNYFATTLISANAVRYVHLYPTEAAVVDGAGTAIYSASIATIILSLGMAIFMSTAINSFWAFINMLQFLSYLPLINVQIPFNLEVFITEYLNINNIVLPFSLFSNVLPL